MCHMYVFYVYISTYGTNLSLLIMINVFQTSMNVMKCQQTVHTTATTLLAPTPAPVCMDTRSTAMEKHVQTVRKLIDGFLTRLSIWVFGYI